MRTALILLLGALFVRPTSAQPIQVCALVGPVVMNDCLSSVGGTPLAAGQTPVVLIHGWNRFGYPAPADLVAWDNALANIMPIPWISANYKFYTFTHRSNVDPVDKMGQTLGRLLDQMDLKDAVFARSNIVVIGHSLGGLIGYSFAEETYQQNGRGVLGGNRVIKLVTFATPFHGTPIANCSARDDKAGPLAGLLIDLIDNGFLDGQMTCVADNRFSLHWDNYDGMFDYVRFANEDNRWLAHLNTTAKFQWKISAYAGVVAPVLDLPTCVSSNLACLAGIMTTALGVKASDGVVPLASASFDGCHGCIAHVALPYDHFQMIAGVTTQDTNIAGSILSELASLIYPKDSRFDNKVVLGNSVSESFHNLRGWGLVNPRVDPVAGPSRFQVIHERSSLDLYVAAPNRSYRLEIQYDEGQCDDSFDVYLDDEVIGGHRHVPVSPAVHTLTIAPGAKYFPNRALVVSLQSIATASCAATVHSLGLF